MPQTKPMKMETLNMYPQCCDVHDVFSVFLLEISMYVANITVHAIAVLTTVWAIDNAKDALEQFREDKSSVDMVFLKQPECTLRKKNHDL